MPCSPKFQVNRSFESANDKYNFSPHESIINFLVKIPRHFQVAIPRSVSIVSILFSSCSTALS